VLEWHVEKRAAGLRQHVAAGPQLAVDVDAPAAAVGHPGGDTERFVDEHRPPVADEHARSHGREAMPRREETAGFVERRADEPAVRDARAGLVVLAEGKRRLVPLDALLSREGQMDSLRVVAATPARLLVVREDSLYRRPPRSKCAW
jgi:hypothetical protein